MSIVVEFLILGVIAVALIFGYRVVIRRMPNNGAYRIGAGLAGIAGFLLFWMNGAVGIIGSADNDANMLYVALLGLALLGGFIARFRPRGLAVVMFAAAFAQVLIPVVAISAGIDITRQEWQWDVANLTLFYVAVWTGSAMMFLRAASEETSADATVTG